MPRLQSIFCTLIVASTLAPTIAWPGTLTYFIDTNTSTLSGDQGYIDLQFNALSGAQNATAAIQNFSTNGLLNPATIVYAGDASGSLAGTVSIANGALHASGYNDYNEALKFGSLTQFEITLSGPALNSPNGSPASTFALSFYAADDSTPLLSDDPSGASATITINPNGSDTIESFPDPNGGLDTRIIASAPEPLSLLLLSLGLLTLGIWHLAKL